jgi:UDP-N-acetylmuramate dehydrogenase
MEDSVQKMVSLAPFTTLGVGGTAKYFYRLEDKKELKSLTKAFKESGLPGFFLGGGSNVLIKDGELDRFVVKNELKGVEFTDCGEYVKVKAGAGEDWDELVAMCVDKELGGLENLSGIPGSVGASPIQNINAYGATVADTIESVEVFDFESEEEKTLSKEECRFAYRDSIFKKPEGKNLLVTAVNFCLKKSIDVNLEYKSSSQSVKKYLEEKNINTPTLKDVREAVLFVRKRIGMVEGCYRSAGSFFKNTILSKDDFARVKALVERDFSELNEKMSPWNWELADERVKVSTAFLMECSPYNKATFGTKRYKDVVGISPLHSLSIVTEEGATAKDVSEFVKMIKDSVREIFQIEIETEVCYVN